MNTPDQDNANQKRSETAWAPPTARMKVGEMTGSARNINVDGRQPMSPLQGFGQMLTQGVHEAVAFVLRQLAVHQPVTDLEQERHHLGDETHDLAVVAQIADQVVNEST